jgi:hypothetical protein
VDDVDDIGVWRAEIRRQARTDRINVRTGFNDGIIWALRVRRDDSTWQAEVARYRDLLARTAPAGGRAATRADARPPGRRRTGLQVRPLLCARVRRRHREHCRRRAVRGRVPERGVAEADRADDDPPPAVALAHLTDQAPVRPPASGRTPSGRSPAQCRALGGARTGA